VLKLSSPTLRQLAESLIIVAIAGCTTAPSQNRWGDNAEQGITWNRTAGAALDAAKSPAVWIPLAGAAVLQVDNWDHSISTWATEHTPIFGSNQKASQATDDMEIVAGLGTLASWLAIPADGDWGAKNRQGIVGLGALAASSLATESLKAVSGRARPNGHGDSFPSGHATFVAAADTLTVRNLESVPMSPSAQTAFTVGTYALTAATAWGRVEAGAHYPSDVLVGVAIGNFFARWFNGAFLDDRRANRLQLSVQPWMRDGAQLTWNWRF
jgi:hypothetical protein